MTENWEKRGWKWVWRGWRTRKGENGSGRGGDGELGEE